MHIFLSGNIQRYIALHTHVHIQIYLMPAFSVQRNISVEEEVEHEGRQGL